jgi:predicted Kef-type K+ transport protein
VEIYVNQDLMLVIKRSRSRPGSTLSHKAAQDTLPLRDAFAVLFFVSVGMLFNPSILLQQPLAVI